MPSSLRRATMTGILLGVLFVPGLLQARTPARDGMRMSRPAVESGFFSVVWDLLTDIFDQRGTSVGSGSSFFAKNGGTMDPNGKPAPPPPSGDTSTSDNGGTMDPNG